MASSQLVSLIALLLLCTFCSAHWQQFFKNKSATLQASVKAKEAFEKFWTFSASSPVIYARSLLVDEENSELVAVADTDQSAVFTVFRIDMGNGTLISQVNLNIQKGSLHDFVLVTRPGNSSILYATWAYKAGWASDCLSAVIGVDTRTGHLLSRFNFGCSHSYYGWDMQLVLSNDGSTMYVQETLEIPDMGRTRTELTVYAFDISSRNVMMGSKPSTKNWDLRLPNGHETPFTFVFTLDDEKQLLYAMNNSMLYQINAATGKLINTLEAEHKTLAIDPTGTYLYLSFVEGTQCFVAGYEQSSLKLLFRTPIPNASYGTRQLIHDGKSLLVLAGRTGYQLDPETGKKLSEVDLCSSHSTSHGALVGNKGIVAVDCNQESSTYLWDIASASTRVLPGSFVASHIVADNQNRLFACGAGRCTGQFLE